jgi:hypothetical protein
VCCLLARGKQIEDAREETKFTEKWKSKNDCVYNLFVGELPASAAAHGRGGRAPTGEPHTERERESRRGVRLTSGPRILIFLNRTSTTKKVNDFGERIIIALGLQQFEVLWT